MASAAVRSKAMDLLVLIRCLLWLPLFVGVLCKVFVFYYAVLRALTSFAIILLGCVALVVFWSLLVFRVSSSWCHGFVCAQCVIVAFFAILTLC